MARVILGGFDDTLRRQALFSAGTRPGRFFMKKLGLVLAVVVTTLTMGVASAFAAGTLRPSAAPLVNASSTSDGCTGHWFTLDSTAFSLECDRTWSKARLTQKVMRLTPDMQVGELVRAETIQSHNVWKWGWGAYKFCEPDGPSTQTFVRRMKASVWDRPGHRYRAVVDTIVTFNC